MNILFRTNIDHYKKNCFPTNFKMPPRIGESVSVIDIFIDSFTKRKLPTRLEVVDVIWSENSIICELWYKSSDFDVLNSSLNKAEITQGWRLPGNW